MGIADTGAGHIESINNKFQDDLQAAVCPELRILLLHEYFCRLLTGFRRPGHIPYYLECLQLLYDALIQLGKLGIQGAGIPPEIWTDLFSRLESCKSLGLQFHIPDLLTELKEMLKAELIRSYFRLLDWEGVTGLTGFDNMAFKRLMLADESPAELRQKNFLETLKGQIPDNMLAILTNELKLLKICRGSCNGLSTMLVTGGGGQEIGILGSLVLSEAEYLRKEGTDQVRISTHLIDVTDPIATQTKEVCGLLHSHFGLDENYRIKLEYDLDLPASTLGGNSMGLALAIMAIDGLKRYLKNPVVQTQYFSDVGITSALAEDGSVVSVDDYGLKLKLRAAFFSRLNAVLIPASQIDLAKRCLAQLAEKYPRRQLKVLSATNINQISYNRELVHEQRRRVTSRISQFVKEYANSVTAMILGFFLVSALGFYFRIVKYPVLDKVMSFKLCKN